MRICINIWLLLFVTSVFGSDVTDFSVTRSYWNVETNTLDVILRADPNSIEHLFANYDKLNVSIANGDQSDFELIGISKGLALMSEKKSSMPHKILIIIDQGESLGRMDALSRYRQLSAEILSKHPSGYVFDVAVQSNKLSDIVRVSKHSLTGTIKGLVESIDVTKPTDFNRLFKFIDIQDYKKLYLLSNGNSPRLMNSMQSYESILDRSMLGNTQILPVSTETVINEEFFSYLNGLNYMSVSRPSYGFIPMGEMPTYLSRFDKQLLLLKYQQTIESPLLNKPYRITVGFEDETIALAEDFTGVLRPFTSSIINTRAGTTYSSIKKSLLYGILLSLVLYFLIPVYNRISFKMNHVCQYGSIKQEGVTHSDPLKMSKIKDDDQVVTYGQHVMLLESWKYIKDNMANPKYAKEYKHFFVDSVDGNLFSQQSGYFKYVLGFWLGSVLATLISLCYIIISQNVFYNWQAIEIYTSISRGFSGELPLLSNTLLIFFMLLGSQLISETVMWSRTKSINSRRLMRKCIEIPVISLLMMSSLYVLHLNGVNMLPISVIIIGEIALYIALSYFATIRKIKINILHYFGIICMVAYVGYQFLSTYVLSIYITDSLVFQVASFIFFSCIACLFINDQEVEHKALGLRIVSPPEIENDIFSLEQHFQDELSVEFSIGKDPQSDLYVKWLDIDVEMNHAIITKKDGQFEIEPQDGNIYINRNQIFDKTIITGNDEIKFGEDSISQLTIINV